MIFVIAALTLVLAYTNADSPPIPYVQSKIQTGLYADDRTHSVADQFGDSFGSDTFGVQSPYEGFLVPASEQSFRPIINSLELKKQGFGVNVIKHLVFFGSKLIPKIAVGATVLFILFLVGGCINALVCTFTPFCTISFQGVGVSKEMMRSYLTPDRISTTATFVMDSIKKYKDLYESLTNEIDDTKKGSR